MKCHAIVMIAILVIVSAAAGKTAAASDTTEDAMISIKDLDWMVGHWQGEAFGGVCEEVWSPVSGGTMVGTFKLLVDGKVKFYEIMTITPDSAGPVLRVKHFDPELKGWEDKDKSAEFRFVRAGDREIQFGGLTYTRKGEDSLRIVVTMSHKDGSTSEEVIECARR